MEALAQMKTFEQTIQELRSMSSQYIDKPDNFFSQTADLMEAQSQELEAIYKACGGTGEPCRVLALVEHEMGRLKGRLVEEREEVLESVIKFLTYRFGESFSAPIIDSIRKKFLPKP
jgi:hypothetical protein